MSTHEKAVAFIDEANLARQAEELRIEIDYKKFLSYLKQNYRLVRAYLYTGMDRSLPRVNEFYLMLKHSGFQVKHRRGKPRADGSVKSNVDVQLAVDMVTMGDGYDVVILVSGDGDFAPAIEAVSRKGVRIDLISLNEHTAEEIRDFADRYIDLRDITSQILYQRNEDAESPNRSQPGFSHIDHMALTLCRKVLLSLKDSLPVQSGVLGTRVHVENPNFDIKQTTFGSFGVIIKLLENKGVVRTTQQGTIRFIEDVDWQNLSKITPSSIQF
jgi:uncharacterized LabA/DUF88 family protein